ncbi:hypothetical protein [Candidatus Burkholderia verschuerenii]|uniref:hypothetical protein n=1 Tax=Candidatus Burkholderia verschuerenii TaxID=242163 RepID=UPI00067BEAFF|nr:hypothetical protein [Candidatus Burkholderia verschuerenii]
MNEQNFDLGAMLTELRDAKGLAEQAATSLRKEEREIDELRAASLAALRDAKGRAGPAAQSAQRLEDAVNRLVSPQYLSVAAGLRECAQAAANLEPIIEQADANRDGAEAIEAAKHLRDFAENFASLRQLARAAAKSNEEALAVLRQIRAAAALM